MTAQTDHRQRFYFESSPVRGDVVRLSRSYASILAQKEYPESIKRLLGEMLTAASLLIGTLKINGRLSIQLQSTDEHSLLNWAMAECDHEGNIRGLARWKQETEEQRHAWAAKTTAKEAFKELGDVGKGVLFINIQPETGEAYQGVVERGHDNLADCLAHYQLQSAQIPTLISLACNGLQAGGLLVQLLPLSEEEKLLAEHGNADEDLWARLSALTSTIKNDELTQLAPNEILYRLYNEEKVVTPEPTQLSFGCTCSKEKSALAIRQLGKEQALAVVKEHGGKIEMDCGFCGALYPFDEADIIALFA
ncbi:MAG: redox-regulated molecular chaperone Hsp33 [Gammaproteobacteria bacterium]|nr:MAG: redox-regulated molecular chaperone Hsp33 [Gammaproteobacteria bacterium]